jgi:PAS domain-containing protein
MDGFGAEQRRFLERYADSVVDVLRAGTGLPAPSLPLGPAPQRLRVGSFVLTPDTGRIEADETLFELAGIALMSVLEPSTQAAGRRELEFRVRRPTGEMRWPSLSCQAVAGTDDRPEQVLGVVTATSVLRQSADDVSRIRWLNAALDDAVAVRDVSGVVVTALGEPLGADQVALAEVQDDRLAVTVLDPPQPAAWPQWWRAEWRSEWPDAPVSALPTLRLALRDGRMDLCSAGTALEPGLAGIGAGVCLVGLDQPHEFVPEERFLPTATAALVIGDVQGHSAGAATIMGQIRTAISAYAVEGPPPDVVVSHTNRLRVDLELRGDRVRVCVSDCSPRAPAKQVWSEIVVPRRERVPADSGPRTERGGLP